MDYKKKQAGDQQRTIPEIIESIKKTCQDSIDRDKVFERMGDIFTPYNF